MTAAVSAGILFGAPAQAPDLTGQRVIQHLNETIAWYGRVTTANQSGILPQNTVLQDSVRQSSASVVKTAFAFANAEAALLGKQKPTSTASPGGNDVSGVNLAQVAERSRSRIANLQSSIDDINQQLAKTRKRKQMETLNSQKAALAADLDFAKISQASLKEMLSFTSDTGVGSGLAGQISLLASSPAVSAALNNAPQPAPASAPRPIPAAFHAETAGIFSLLSNSFSVTRTQSEIRSLIGTTEKLTTETDSLSNPLRARARALVLQSDSLASAVAGETDPDKINAARQQLQALTSKFKSSIAPTLSLAEQGIALRNTSNSLAQADSVLREQLHTVLGYLAFRLGTVIAAIAVIWFVSEIVRRGTFRYIKETRRRRQIVLMRRVVFGALTTLIVLLASVNGFGSFATMAGFITAGLAVALQNVILSVVAYFFLIGRYGLRTGDRVTVTNVPGQVIEVGLVRFYLMELAGTGADLHSTGRVAVFSNSVIFQPAALIKQAPGTEYTWHSVSTTFTDDVVLEEARRRVSGAVLAVYTKYSQTIQNQQEAFERTANIQLTNPEPVSRARYTDQGVEVLVRYPVELTQMSEVDEEVILAVMHETQKEPALKLSSGGFPKVLTT